MDSKLVEILQNLSQLCAELAKENKRLQTEINKLNGELP